MSVPFTSTLSGSLLRSEKAPSWGTQKLHYPGRSQPRGNLNTKPLRPDTELVRQSVGLVGTPPIPAPRVQTAGGRRSRKGR